MEHQPLWDFFKATGPWGVVFFLLTMIVVGKLRHDREYKFLEKLYEEEKHRSERHLDLADRSTSVGQASVAIMPDPSQLRRIEEDLATLKRQLGGGNP